MARSQETEQNRLNVIGEGTRINGDINADGDIRIDGKIEGNVTIDGKLVLGQKGKISGEIRCINTELSGAVEGKLFVNELLSLKASANIQGDIKTKRIAIEPGAVFTGTCNMEQGKAAPVENKNAKSKK